MLIGITDYVPEPFDVEASALPPHARLIGLNAEHESEVLERDLEKLDALLVWHAPVTPRIAERLKSCKIVVRYGVGFDNIHIGALAERGIPFCNTPDYGTEEVADTAVAMILTLQRKVVEYDRRARAITSGWQEHVLPPLARSSTRTVGIVGLGRIGTAVALRLKAFGYTIIGFDPYQPSGYEKAIGVARARSLKDLLAAADIVTIHCPLTAETRGMIDEPFVAAMRPGATLVNSARGPILKDLSVIEAALRSGHLAGVGLDVLPQEPPSAHPLLDDWRGDADWLVGRLLINPHSAYYSAQAWRDMRYKAAETAAMYLADGTLRNRIG